jgi:hypothetical protein
MCRASIPMLLSMSIAGLPNVGADVAEVVALFTGVSLTSHQAPLRYG